MTKVIELNNDNFNQVVNNNNTALVEFFASWCGHCKNQAPILEDFAKEMGEKLTVAKLDIEEHENKAIEYAVSGIPVFLVFHNGKLVKQAPGFHPINELKRLVNPYL